MKSRSVLVAIFVMCTAVLTLLPFSQPASAAPDEPWARWFIELEFVNNKPAATMTVEIGHDTRLGQRVVEIQETYELACRETGTLNITNNVAEFDGNSYLTCEMPVFQDLVGTLTSGKLKIDRTCECKLANGQAHFAFSASSENPFFYLEGLQFAAPNPPTGPNVQYALTVAGVTAVSEVFAPTKQIQQGGGEFVQSGPGYEIRFQVNGTVLGGSPSSISGQLEVPTDQNQFYIGFNPDSGEILQGRLEYLFIDPGCVGHGGI
ncbi:MAG: hypothetical protein IPM53_05975 [Anaerolineaceae bacterium]|nr:hypothetical protein [Anaerolineaceae bacterium]